MMMMMMMMMIIIIIIIIIIKLITFKEKRQRVSEKGALRILRILRRKEMYKISQ